MNVHATKTGAYRMGSLFADSQPDFDFAGLLPLPAQEFEERLRLIRRQAAHALA